MTARRVRIAVGAVSFLLLTSAAFFLLTRQRQEPFLAEGALADGVHRVRLLRVTDGPLDYDWRAPVSPTLRKYLPSQILPPEVHFRKVTMSGKVDRTPGWSFLFRTVDANGNYANLPVEAVIEESTGFLFPTEEKSGPEVQHFGVTGITVTALPRRDAKLKFLIYERGKRASSTPAILEVDNPAFRSDVSTWAAETLPATKMGSGYPIQLASIGVSKTGKPELIYSIDGGHPRKAVPAEFWLEDATGNRGAELSPFEPVWKVHLEALHPTARFSGCRDEELWDLGEIQRPGPGEHRLIQESRLVNGLMIEVFAALGPGQYEIDDGVITCASKTFDLPGATGSKESIQRDGESREIAKYRSSSPLLIVRARSEPIPRSELAGVNRLHHVPRYSVLVEGQYSTTSHHAPSFSGLQEITTSHLLEARNDSKPAAHVRIAVTRPLVAEFNVTPPTELKELARTIHEDVEGAGNGN
jgi:hypothetical protein